MTLAIPGREGKKCLPGAIRHLLGASNDFSFRDGKMTVIAPIEQKLKRGERLSFEDGVALFEHPDFLEVGRLANRVRERLWGARTFYNVNLHINPTNSCVAHCEFCAFGRKPFDEAAYIRPPEEIVERARRLMPPRCTEIHLVGGLDPRLKIEYYCDCLRALKTAFPGVHIKALTPVEIHYIAKISGIEVRETLERLRRAGLDSMPGGGAEIFDPEIRERLCAHKCDASEWFEVHRILHAEMGLRTNCTMLYGHIEAPRHRVDHLLRLRDHQDRYAAINGRGADKGQQGAREGQQGAGEIRAGFQCFIPLSFQPANTALAHLPGPGGVDDLRTIAVARLLLDNIPHIKAYWVGLGPKLAQTALWFGADDLDGTVVCEEVFHDAGAPSPRGVTEDQLRALIREAGRTPILRDSHYNPLEPAGIE